MVQFEFSNLEMSKYFLKLQAWDMQALYQYIMKTTLDFDLFKTFKQTY